MYLAELNIARALYPLDDPRMSGFTDNIDALNNVAERSKGFIWRLKGDSGSALDIPWANDPSMLVNMSVWATPEDLERYVWNTVHKKIYDKKSDWFPQMEMKHFVMWWVPENHIPSLDEASERLDFYRANGSTETAFGWDNLTNLKAWRNKQCG